MQYNESTRRNLDETQRHAIVRTEYDRSRRNLDKMQRHAIVRTEYDSSSRRNFDKMQRHAIVRTDCDRPNTHTRVVQIILLCVEREQHERKGAGETKQGKKYVGMHNVCVLDIKSSFLHVAIRHSQCPCRFFNPREILALESIEL